MDFLRRSFRRSSRIGPHGQRRAATMYVVDGNYGPKSTSPHKLQNRGGKKVLGPKPDSPAPERSGGTHIAATVKNTVRRLLRRTKSHRDAPSSAPVKLTSPDLERPTVPKDTDKQNSTSAATVIVNNAVEDGDSSATEENHRQNAKKDSAKEEQRPRPEQYKNQSTNHTQNKNAKSSRNSKTDENMVQLRHPPRNITVRPYRKRRSQVRLSFQSTCKSLIEFIGSKLHSAPRLNIFNLNYPITSGITCCITSKLNFTYLHSLYIFYENRAIQQNGVRTELPFRGEKQQLMQIVPYVVLEKSNS